MDKVARMLNDGGNNNNVIVDEGGESKASWDGLLISVNFAGHCVFFMLFP